MHRFLGWDETAEARSPAAKGRSMVGPYSIIFRVGKKAALATQPGHQDCVHEDRVSAGQLTVLRTLGRKVTVPQNISTGQTRGAKTERVAAFLVKTHSCRALPSSGTCGCSCRPKHMRCLDSRLGAILDLPSLCCRAKFCRFYSRSRGRVSIRSLGKSRLRLGLGFRGLFTAKLKSP